MLETVRRVTTEIVDWASGAEDEHWSRVVMHREQRRAIEALDPSRLEVLEISGRHWADFGFRRYRSVAYPGYDLCRGPLPDSFDLIIAEQVFEHLLWPYRAGRHAHAMLRPGGHLLVSTPFLVRVHPAPHDCTRWTETGLRYFLAECGFPLASIETGSWGNRACIRANLRRWTRYRRRLHSLANEPAYPYHVWALAQKAPATPSNGSAG